VIGYSKREIAEAALFLIRDGVDVSIETVNGFGFRLLLTAFVEVFELPNNPLSSFIDVFIIWSGEIGNIWGLFWQISLYGLFAFIKSVRCSVHPFLPFLLVGLSLLWL
jgi:hypothetical protein